MSEVLFICGAGLAIGWVSVLIAMLIDKIAGTPVMIFNRLKEGYHGAARIPPQPWWKHVLKFPLYCITIVSVLYMMAIFIPPMWLVSRISGRNKIQPPAPTTFRKGPTLRGHV